MRQHDSGGRAPGLVLVQKVFQHPPEPEFLGFHFSEVTKPELGKGLGDHSCSLFLLVTGRLAFEVPSIFEPQPFVYVAGGLVRRVLKRKPGFEICLLEKCRIFSSQKRLPDYRFSATHRCHIVGKVLLVFLGNEANKASVVTEFHKQTLEVETLVVDW